MFKLGVDIGGTFTDFTLINEKTEEMFLEKEPTTEEDPSVGFLQGMRRILSNNDTSADEVETIIHGTTLVSNTIIEQTGAKTGLLTTAGMRDELEHQRGDRYDVYDWDIEYPDPLVPRERRLEISERLDADGEVVTPIDADEVRARARELVEHHGVESIAVVLLHSYQSNQHEQTIRNVIEEEYPDVHVSLSSDVAAFIREYERTSTTVVNAYVAPVVESYLDTLQSGLKKEGFSGRLELMTSAGGIIDLQTARAEPVRIVESGPAAGVLVNNIFGRQHEMQNVLSFDMGGTTAKGAIIQDGELPIRYEKDVARVYRFKEGSGYDIMSPMIDLTEIGAGGGSIAKIDKTGLIDVGPESSGSKPGPACYDRGGTRPTVTDAALLLGYLNPKTFFGGRLELNLKNAKDAFQDHLAHAHEGDLTEIAWQVYDIVNENMATAFRKHASSRGIDPQQLSILTIGGAGPMMAAQLARKVGVGKVVCPYGSGVGSSIGLVRAPRQYDASVTRRQVLSEMTAADFRSVFGELSDEADGVLDEARIDTADAEAELRLDMRHVQQGYEIEVPLPGYDIHDVTPEVAREQFRRTYREKFGRDILDFPIEVLNFHLTIRETKDTEAHTHEYTTREHVGEDRTGSREVYFGPSGYVDADIYEWDALSAGFSGSGPAIVEADETTAVIDPESKFNLAENRDLVIDLEGGR